MQQEYLKEYENREWAVEVDDITEYAIFRIPRNYGGSAFILFFILKNASLMVSVCI